jgi:hypothetical protein
MDDELIGRLAEFGEKVYIPKEDKFWVDRSMVWVWGERLLIGIMICEWSESREWTKVGEKVK